MLKRWWRLDVAELQKQIKAAFKTTLPLAERSEWQDYFEGEQAKIADFNRQ
jgi:hypothetical protein